MARLARVVVPGHPHHVTRRGNGRARTFFSGADYAGKRGPKPKAPADEAQGELLNALSPK